MHASAKFKGRARNYKHFTSIGREGFRVDHLHKCANDKETSGSIASLSDCNIIAVVRGAGAVLVALNKK